MLTPSSTALGTRLGGALALSLVLWGSACSTAIIEHPVIPCGPETCDGCCSASGQCRPGTSPFACGGEGAACDRCGPSETCTAGACVASVEGEPDAGAGLGCGPSTCRGCCQNNECIDPGFQSAEACGSNGGACVGCVQGDVCVLGACERASECRLVLKQEAGIDFGRATVGTEWDVRFELENRGTESCKVSPPAWISGTDTRAFSFKGAEAFTPFTLAPGGRSHFTVTFSPRVSKVWEPDQNAFTFVVDDRAPSRCARLEPGCRHISVTGVGSPSDLPPLWSVLPGAIDFGEVSLGCESIRRAAMVVNVSPEPLRIENAGIVNGSGFLLTDSRGTPIALPLQIPAWGTARLYVRFAPQATGAVTGRLRVLVGNDQRDLPLSATGVTSAPLTYTTVQQPPGDVDLLFVVHTGKEMDGIQSELRAAAPDVIARLASADGSFHVGVISSDASRSTSGRLYGSPKFVVPGPQASAELERNLDVGSGWSLPDQSLESLRVALIPPNSTTANAGFLRANSRLGVIVISNADERSGAPVDHYLHALYGAKGGGILGAQRAHLYGLTTAESCESGDRYAELLHSSTRNCYLLSPGSVRPALDEILEDLLQVQTGFMVSSAIGEVLSVQVDGVPVPASGYELEDSSSGMIRFRPGFVPEQGQQIEITWSPICQPNR